MEIGFAPNNLFGIDIIGERIESGCNKYPNMNFICDDASQMPLESNMFDLVLESTMFVQLTDEGLAREIATEMLRVTKPHGYLLLIDWRYTKPWNSNYCGLSTRRIRKIFSVGSSSRIICKKNGAMVPPLSVGSCPNMCHQHIFFWPKCSHFLWVRKQPYYKKQMRDFELTGSIGQNLDKDNNGADRGAFI